MYESVNRESVIEEMNKGVTLYCVDIPTLRTMNCDELNLHEVKYFISKPESMFFKRVTSE